MTEVIPIPLHDRTGATVAFAVIDAADARLAERPWHPTYAEMARERIRRDAPLLNTSGEVAA